ncbi:hypothetical protein NDU88_001373 [Pleurodeles waltl]|uniref:Uncharacterized protein n=1 Tax=Pleurodeles waltl TaxID=8319 RepID=A0AAV7MJJ9_PLEWA|nr:hypothetical protein NDU88_001373 [Pleurodeles waltl]
MEEPASRSSHMGGVPESPDQESSPGASRNKTLLPVRTVGSQSRPEHSHLDEGANDKNLTMKRVAMKISVNIKQAQADCTFDYVKHSSKNHKPFKVGDFVCVKFPRLKSKGMPKF